jgi:hypothetical protein
MNSLDINVHNQLNSDGDEDLENYENEEEEEKK